MANSKRSRGKAHHERQRLTAARHKTYRSKKRAERLAFWVAKGVKKNGRRVLSMEERKTRAAERHTRRKEVKAQMRAERAKLWRENEKRRNARPTKFKEEGDE